MPNRARIVVGRDGRIALVNELAERLLGMRAHELLGSRSEELVAERHRALHIAQRDAYLAEPWSLSADTGFFVTVTARLGHERLIFAVPEPIATEDGLWVSVTLHPPTASAAFTVFNTRSRSRERPAPSEDGGRLPLP